MRIGLIVQARLGSKRLPKKILEKIYKTTIIDFILDKLKKSKLIECYILATTKKKEDLILKKFANKNNFFFFTGSKDNVLKRFYSAAKKFKLDVVIRCTGDSPFMNHKIVDKFINFFIKKKLDYLSNILKPSYPLGIHVEIFNFSTLEKAFFEAKKKNELEHVTPYIYNNPKKFKIKNLGIKKNYSNYRLTLDYLEDLKLLKILSSFLKKKDFSYQNAVSLMEKKPQLKKINHLFKKKFTSF